MFDWSDWRQRGSTENKVKIPPFTKPFGGDRCSALQAEDELSAHLQLFHCPDLNFTWKWQNCLERGKSTICTSQGTQVWSSTCMWWVGRLSEADERPLGHRSTEMTPNQTHKWIMAQDDASFGSGWSGFVFPWLWAAIAPKKKRLIRLKMLSHCCLNAFL